MEKPRTTSQPLDSAPPMARFIISKEQQKPNCGYLSKKPIKEPEIKLKPKQITVVFIASDINVFLKL